MKKIFYLSAVLWIASFSANAQTNIFPSTGAAGIGTTTPDASAIFEIKSQIQGFLPPRMTKANQKAIFNPAKGLMVYVVDGVAPGYYYYNGLKWLQLNGNNYTAGTGINITGTTITNSAPNIPLTLTGSGGTTVSGTYPNFNVSSAAPTNYSAGTGLSLTGNTFANTAPDQIVSLTGSGAATITGTYPNFTISSTDNNTAYTAGSGLNLAGNTFTNTAPDQTVSIAAGTGINVTGSYPNFAISSTATQGWSLNGNAGTDPNVNFIGTTDAQPLVFKVNNTNAGILDYDPTKKNTGFGYGAFSNNTSGIENTAFGWQTLFSNTSGSSNTATGYRSLFFNNGNNNTASGGFALHSNISGNANTASGISALVSNTSGNNNTAIGSRSLAFNTTGTSNIAIGTDALHNNTNRSNLVAVGDSALYNNAQEINNADAINNTALGSKTLYANTTGSFNTATGYNALLGNIGGSFNTSNGAGALYQNTSGASNTAVGNGALFSNTTGSFNIAVGGAALYNNAIGSNNTSIGYASGPTNFNLSNTSAIGFNAFTSDDNQVRIGNANVTSIGGFANWTNISDGRVKRNIKQNVPGLAFINKLNPLTYNLDLDAADKIIQRPVIKDKEGKTIQPSRDEITSRKAKEAIVYTGFVAQDVEKAAKSLNYNFSGVDAAKNDKDLYGLRYAEFVVPLVKAVQELSAKNDDLQKQIDELKTIMFSGNQNNPTSVQKVTSTFLTNTSLEQNIPNPFSNATTIGYTLPQKFIKAQIIITDKAGKTLKTVNIPGSGKGSLKVDAATLASGAYSYSLYVDGKLIGTKQMVVSR